MVVATYTTTTLTSQTNQLTAVYSGDYQLRQQHLASGAIYHPALPSVTLNLPTTVELSSPSPTPMSVTITNPGTSRSWSSNYLYL